MVLTRSGREVQRRLSVGSTAGAASASAGKKTKGSRRNKHVEGNPEAVPETTRAAESTPRHWFVRMLLMPLAPFFVIWSLSGIFMMVTGPVYPESHPVWGTRGRCSQYARRALGVFILVAAGTAYGVMSYQKAKRAGRFDGAWGAESTVKGDM